jgi:hypothetical protein
VALRELSGSLFIDLVAELRALDNPSMPVLIAVDQYNTWEVPSAYAYNNQQLLGKQLCVPHALNFLSAKKAETAAWTMKNGVCIGEYCVLIHSGSYLLTCVHNAARDVSGLLHGSTVSPKHLAGL